MICKRFAMRARLCFDAGEVPLEEEFKGKRVVISADGGRVRTRVNKRGKKPGRVVLDIKQIGVSRN
jgi:hypothetical protein